MSRIVIQTGARLHFGLLALGQSPPDGSEPGTGREFGGVGLMVKSPGFRISLAPNSPIENLADSIVHLGSSPAPALELIDRVGRILSRYRERCPAEFRPAGMQIELQETVSQHIGLGTGTQLALAIARGLAEIMGEGPIPATKLALKKAGLTLQQMDVIESNEAFAAQAIAVARGLELDMSKTNVNGGAIALGHPIGCSGAFLATKAVYELHRSNGRYALVTMCIGGGQGIAAVFERL